MGQQRMSQILRVICLCCFYIIVKKNRSLNMSQVNDLDSIHPTNGWYCCSYLRSDMSEDETARCRIPSEKRRRFRVVYTRLREKPGWVMRCRLTVPYQRPSPDGVQAPPPYFILTPPTVCRKTWPELDNINCTGFDKKAACDTDKSFTQSATLTASHCELVTSLSQV